MTEIEKCAGSDGKEQPGGISQAGSVCPACDRFIGPADACPYCGADSARSPLLVRLRVVAILLALLGLGYLYAAAHWNRPVTVPIGTIGPTMNFAIVRVAGEVVRAPYAVAEDGQTNYVSFVVADGTGEIQVRAYREVAGELARAGGIPPRGASVEVEGSLKVTAGGDRGTSRRLHLAAADKLKILSMGTPGRGEAGSVRENAKP